VSYIAWIRARPTLVQRVGDTGSLEIRSEFVLGCFCQYEGFKVIDLRVHEMLETFHCKDLATTLVGNSMLTVGRRSVGPRLGCYI
jgi:hypothetical protein